MRREIERVDWADYFDQFNKRNRWRPTKLEAIMDAGAEEIESGLPFVGIALDASAESLNLKLLLGEHDEMDPRHMSYVIWRVRRVASCSASDERDEELEIEDEGGRLRLLRFEALPPVSPIYC